VYRGVVARGGRALSSRQVWVALRLSAPWNGVRKVAIARGACRHLQGTAEVASLSPITEPQGRGKLQGKILLGEMLRDFFASLYFK
jgi:hypothetical protein